MKKWFGLAVLLIVCSDLNAQVNQAVGDLFEESRYREFDFWQGEWDVNLRVQQQDKSWQDAVKSTARIYRILDGRAILELWNENKYNEGIKGYSLRYFDDTDQEWKLWLNWPGPNRSGSSSHSGTFRHGRGEFFSESMTNDSTVLISRYSFNDITPHSLRWDDAYSRDGGKTWSSNWIMEFSRAKDLAPEFRFDRDVLTFDEGKRCDRKEFRHFERLVGEWKGGYHILEEDITVPYRLRVYNVLDGCAVLVFGDYVNQGRVSQTVSLNTFNTFAEMYEEGRLDNNPNHPFKIFYGQSDGSTISMKSSMQNQAGAVEEKSEWTFEGEAVIWRSYQKKGSLWEKTAEVILSRI